MDGTNWLDGKASLQIEHVRFAELIELYFLYLSNWVSLATNSSQFGRILRL